MNKNTNDTIIQLSLWLGIPALILGIMGSIHALLKDSLLSILKKLSFETISLSILILLSCLVVAVTYILYLYKKLRENKPETIDIAPVLKEAKERMKQISNINIDDFDQPEELCGVSKHKKTGKLYCTSCLVENIKSPILPKMPKEHGWYCPRESCDKQYLSKAYYAQFDNY